MSSFNDNVGTIPLREYRHMGNPEKYAAGNYAEFSLADKRRSEGPLHHEFIHSIKTLDMTLPEKFSDRCLILPSTTGLDALTLEDRVRLLYTANSILGASWRPHGNGDSVSTYVNAALDRPIVSSDTEYEEALLRRAYSIFDNPQSVSPEEFSELRRVAERLGISQKVADYDYFSYTRGLDSRVKEDSIAGGRYNLEAPNRIFWMLTDEGTVSVDAALGSRTTLYEKAAFTFLIWWNYLTEFLLGAPFYEEYEFTSKYDHKNGIYFPKSPVQSSSGTCGTSISLYPMKEDPGKFFADIDLYLRALEIAPTYIGGVAQKLLSSTLGGELAAVFQLSPINLALVSGSNVLVFLLFVVVALFTTAAHPAVRSWSILHLAVVLEIISVCFLVLFATVSLIWFDTAGFVFALSILVVSGCELAVILAFFVSLKSTRACMPLVVLFSNPSTSRFVVGGVMVVALTVVVVVLFLAIRVTRTGGFVRGVLALHPTKVSSSKNSGEQPLLLGIFWVSRKNSR